ncbi:MAG: glycosyltransferase family 4 protein [Desulfohalobiaceae bacterium]|nr:glycosyltransferase family 4 protein [Desulfohalobiaceae bacterium]
MEQKNRYPSGGPFFYQRSSLAGSPAVRTTETKGGCTRLRIALLSYRSNPYCGGQGIYVKYLSQSLAALGHKVDVISGEPYPDLDPGVRLIPMPGLNFYGYEKPVQAVKDRGLSSLTDVREYLGHLSGGFPEPLTFGRRASKYLLNHVLDYDLVHDNQSLSFGLLALTRRKIPLVTTVHHPITRDLRTALAGAQNWGLRLLIRRWHSFLWMQKKVAPRLPRVITVSASSKRDLIQDFKLDPKRVDVIHNGVDVKQFTPLPGIKKIPGRIMTTTSADVPLKGLAYLLEAVQGLQDEIPDINLTVLGKPKQDGPTRHLLKTLGLDSRVRFVNGLNTGELCREYAQSVMAVVPSLYEGFGLPAAEAMACGLPVVSTSGGALPEVVGDAGILVPPGNAPALARGIRAVFENHEYRQSLGSRGRERIKKLFTWELAAARTVRTYQKIMHPG